MKSILPEQYEVEKQFNSRTDDFLSKHQIGKILHGSNFRKQKGDSCFRLFKFIFLLVFFSIAGFPFHLLSVEFVSIASM